MSSVMTKSVNGIASSPGITIAKAVLLKSYKINNQPIFNTELEISRLLEAISAVKMNFEKKETATNMRNVLSNLNIQQLILQDYDLIDQMKSRIQFESNKAEIAWKSVTQKYITMFEQMNTEYMKKRANAMKEVSKIILEQLNVSNNLGGIINSENVVLVADHLTSSELAQIDLKYVTGIATNKGTYASHCSIMARSQGLPAVVGTGTITSEIYEGENVIIDGYLGEIIIEPTSELIQEYKDKIKKYNRNKVGS